MKEVPGNVLDKYLLWHALNGHKENMELLTQTIGEENFKEMYSLEKVLKEFIPLLALDTHVVQLHISNDRKTIRQKGSFDTQKKINPFRYSHGKGLFSVRVLDEDFGEAFHLQHSLTQVPHNGVREGELYLNPKVDYKLKSQHAFCASITAANVRSFMKSLAASSPQVVIVNLDRDLIKHRVGDENMALIDKIVTPPFSKVLYYYYSQLEENGGNTLLKGSAGALDNFLLWHSLNAHKENRVLLEDILRNKVKVDDFSRFDRLLSIKNKEDVKEFAPHANILQVYFSNDAILGRAPKPFRNSHGKACCQFVYKTTILVKGTIFSTHFH